MFTQTRDGLIHFDDDSIKRSGLPINFELDDACPHPLSVNQPFFRYTFPMKTLTQRPDITHPKTAALYKQLSDLLNALSQRALTPEIVALIDHEIDHINYANDTGKKLGKTVKAAESKIIKAVEKELKVVPRNHYRKLWAIFGFTAFGLPIGVTIGLLLKNIGLLGVGLPFGMIIGLLVGSSMDKKAAVEGRQLDFEVKH